MTFYLIGIDYRTVSLDVMEEAHRLRAEITEYWRSANPGKVAVLATCNRVEIYGVAPMRSTAIELEKSFRRVFASSFKDAYVRYGYSNIFEHGVCLACGLKSQLRGERQILQQLRGWACSGDFPEPLKRGWRRIVETAEKIRIRAELEGNVVNIAEVVFDDIAKNIDINKKVEIMVVGTGKVAELIAERGHEFARLVFVARKKKAKARKLASLSGGTALLRDEMHSRLIATDVVVSATSSPHYALTMRDFGEIVKKRVRPLYIYDLAMPRDVSPDVCTLPFVKVKNLDDLSFSFYRKHIGLMRRLELAAKLAKEYSNAEEDKTRYTAEPACLKTS